MLISCVGLRTAPSLSLPFLERCHLKHAQALHHQLAVIQGHVQLVLEDEGAGEVLVQLCCFWHLTEEEKRC